MKTEFDKKEYFAEIRKMNAEIKNQFGDVILRVWSEKRATTFYRTKVAFSFYRAVPRFSISKVEEYLNKKFGKKLDVEIRESEARWNINRYLYVTPKAKAFQK